LNLRERSSGASRRRDEQAAARRVLAASLSAGSSSGPPSSGALGGPVQGAYAGPPAVCPVGPVHSFTDTWHAARSGGRQHQGTDVFAPHGSPAYAVVDGVVDKWSGGGLGGIALWLRGDDGTRYYYAHNSANVAPVGARVRAGELIAYVGKTGNAETTPPHVHFEAHPGGGPAHNPYPWLAAICAG
jgi:murein DD-endopeptidase MepM/ murein hydrolase activator NlpD